MTIYGERCLVHRHLKGDYSAMRDIEGLIREYGRDIYSFCVYLTGSRDLADDLYQQTFLIALEKNEIDFSANPKSYLLSVAVNVRNNQRRKLLWRRSKFEMVPVDTELGISSSDDTEEEVIRKERELQVRKAVAELPEKMRQVVVLFYTEEMSITQIAEILKVSEGTVKSRLHNARKTLKERLARYE